MITELKIKEHPTTGNGSSAVGSTGGGENFVHNFIATYIISHETTEGPIIFSLNYILDEILLFHIIILDIIG